MSLCVMGIQPPGPPPPRAAGATTARAPGAPDLAEAEVAVTALYQVHALGLVRLAHVMLGDRAAAEDIVQEACSTCAPRCSMAAGQPCAADGSPMLRTARDLSS